MVTRNHSVAPRASSGLSRRLLTPLLIAALLLVGLAVYTVVNGELRLPFGGGVLFAFQKEEQQAEARPALPRGTVGVLACARPLPAFTKLTREHLLTREGMHTVPVVPEAIEPNGLFPADTDGIKALLGRVLRRAKPVNFAFTESDLLPKGTRAGPSAGIPPGKRGVWLNLEKIPGVAAAQAGDLVDLVASTTVKGASQLDTSVLGNLSDPIIRTRLDKLAARSGQQQQTKSWVIARGALVITPKHLREISGGGGSKRAEPETVAEAFVAMEPEEVARFSEALAQGVTILATPRSGQPEDQPTEIPDSEVFDAGAELRRMLTGDGGTSPAFGMVEMIQGGQRQTITVPRANSAPGKR